uniref:Ion-translocating oxidoreductase complex subunit G n=1 Tax=Gracilinema caldarium TaxID=215591 RepID=A0A7C3E3K4_9SPIR
MKNMVKLGFIMAVYATVACVSLAFVYTGTQKVIAERQKADLEAALKDLFPQGESFEEITGTLQSPDTSVAFKNEYVIKKDNAPIGVAVRGVGASYGGPVTVLVGVGADGKIAGVKVLENKDTPGLGANAANPSYFVDRASGITFYGQFKGKSLSDPFEVKGDVIAITASTITSKAVTRVVKTAGQTAGAWLAAQTGGSK